MTLGIVTCSSVGALFVLSCGITCFIAFASVDAATMAHLGFKLSLLTLILLWYVFGGPCEFHKPLQYSQEFLLPHRDLGTGVSPTDIQVSSDRGGRQKW